MRICTTLLGKKILTVTIFLALPEKKILTVRNCVALPGKRILSLRIRRPTMEIEKPAYAVNIRINVYLKIPSTPCWLIPGTLL